MLSGLTFILTGLILYTISRRFHEFDRQYQNLVDLLIKDGDKN
jgi:hypothetical protein